MKPVGANKSVFVGGNVTASVLLWLLPVIDSFCKEKRVTKLVLDRPLPRRVKNASHVQAILQQYEVVVFGAESKGLARLQKIFWGFRASLNFFQLISLVFSVSRDRLLLRQERYQSQLFHAVWDSACLGLKDGSIVPSIAGKLAASVRVLAAVTLANHVVEKHGVRAAFLGHLVYRSRGTLAAFQSSGVQVFSPAGGALYECPATKDTSWAAPGRLLWDKIANLFTDADVEKYWQGRTIGRSTYADSQIAARGTKRVRDSTPKNILLLHVFRDSPFNQIDESRIFADYIDWVANTLPAIARSEETWLIKLHPSAKRWGEDQQTFLSEICKFALGSREVPSNAEVISDEYSNMELFEHGNRVVTFGGTGHLEAACWGIRPITVMDVGLAVLDSSAVHLPRTIKDYDSLLSLPSNSETFVLSAAQITLARSLLFARENVLGLGDSLGHLAVYRGDSEQVSQADFESVLRTVPSRKRELAVLGERLARGAPRSVSLDYLDQWLKLLDGGENRGARLGPTI